MVKLQDLEVGKAPIFLCSVIENNVKDTLIQTNDAIRKGADGIELRLDKLKKKSMIKDVILKTNCPALVVCRPRHLDGYFRGTEAERAEWLSYALDYSPMQ